MNELRPSEVRKFIIGAVQSGLVPYVGGPPGIGKSEIVAQIAEEANLQLKEVFLSQMLVEDVIGIPNVVPGAKKAEYIPFSTFPLEGDPLPKDANGDDMDGWLIFLDELSSADDQIFAAIYTLLLQGVIGGHKIHPAAKIVAAGNRESDSAVARALPETLITRMIICEMKASSKDWVKWAQNFSGKNDSVVNFIKKFPDMLMSTVSPDSRGELEPVNSPRTWAKCFNIVNVHEKLNSKQATDSAGIPLSGEVSGTPITKPIMHLLQGQVGKLAAQRFKEDYDESMTIAAPWEIAQSPASAKIPSTEIGKSEMTNQLAAYWMKSEDQTRQALLVYMNRMDKEHASLFASLIKNALGTTPSDLKLVTNVEKRLGVLITDRADDEDRAEAAKKAKEEEGKKNKNVPLSPGLGSIIPDEDEDDDEEFSF